MRAEIALMSGSAFAVTHHAFSSGAGRTSDGNGSHASTLKSPSYTKSVSWQHYPTAKLFFWLILISSLAGKRLAALLAKFAVLLRRHADIFAERAVKTTT
ncbi:hypothetical protein PWR53_13575 [Escherichia coli]|nr:hypothetical protein PWR53_13575 [Escherichia coli]